MNFIVTHYLEILPKLGTLINDNSTGVRSALIVLLTRVKAVRSIQYTSIVSKACLLDRLVTDSEQMKRQIASLILNSFFPYNKTPSEIVCTLFHRVTC
jgi:hypothetical protein